MKTKGIFTSANPYLYFNGDCIKAITLYEKAFNVKAEVMPNREAENLVEHAKFKIGNDAIFLCDAQYPVKTGDNMMIATKFDATSESTTAAAKAAFDILKEDGQVIMKLEETSWNKCFGILIDKFGVKWNMCGGLK